MQYHPTKKVKQLIRHSNQHACTSVLHNPFQRQQFSNNYSCPWHNRQYMRENGNVSHLLAFTHDEYEWAEWIEHRFCTVHGHGWLWGLSNGAETQVLVFGVSVWCQCVAWAEMWVSPAPGCGGAGGRAKAHCAWSCRCAWGRIKHRQRNYLHISKSWAMLFFLCIHKTQMFI